MRILVIGPSPTRSKGGMATVISEIAGDQDLRRKYNIDIYESYIDGGLMTRIIYSIFAFFMFCLTKRHYDIYHIHMASRGSTFRKGYYARMAKKWGKKVIVHIHGAQYMEFFSELSSPKKKKVIKILKSADMVIALSESWKEKFEKEFGLTNCVSLPNGINTVVGESGIKLSGGQRQRLAIARALLRQTSIIIFDESTSSLDNFAQEHIKKCIDNLKGKSTIVIVAHRLSTIRNVDNIFFLEDGKIVDEGSFNELFRKNKEFKNMFTVENLQEELDA